MTYLKPLRDGEMPALKAVAELVPTLDFADKQTLVPEIQRAAQSLTALQAESWDALSKPKAARRPELVKEHFTEETGLLGTLEKLSARLFAAVKHSDPFVDQMLEMLIAGEKPEMTATQWSPYTVSRLSTVLGVAEAALTAAKEYGEVQRSAAQRELAMQLALLAASLALAIGSMIAVSRRVINP